MNKEEGIELPINRINENVLKAAKEILNFSLPLVKRSGKEPVHLEAVASGVLIQIHRHHFLITAGHLFEDYQAEEIGISIGTTFRSLTGKLRWVNPSESQQNALIDLAVWKLEDDITDDLSERFRFFDFRTADFDRITFHKPRYLIVGFPTSHVKRKLDYRKKTADPFIFLAREAERELYEQLNFPRSVGILLYFQRSAVTSFKTGSTSSGPDLTGVSGAGLWYLPKLLTVRDTVPSQLVGIMTAWNKRDNVVIATRTVAIAEILSREFGISL